MGEIRVRGCLLRTAQLGCQHLPGYRSGADHCYDRKPTQRPFVEVVHEHSRHTRGTQAPGVLQPVARRHGAALMQGIDPWIEREYRHAAAAMLPSFSPVELVKDRPGFGQTVRPVKGSIVASPVLAAYDPDPDYFFHWFRDSAVIIDALRLIRADGSVAAPKALEYFHDFVEFSLSLLTLDGHALVSSSAWRAGVQADFEKFVRPDD